MYHLNILSAGFTTPNGRAFLMPLILHQRALEEMGIRVKIFHDVVPELFYCSHLAIDSKFHAARWFHEKAAVLDEFAAFREKADKILFFDITDSASFDHADMIANVDLYCKAQLLTDRAQYLRPLYGIRYFTDHYHTEYGIEDDDPLSSIPLQKPEYLEKLAVGWNSGLADYSHFGPYRMAMYEKLPLRCFLRYSDAFKAPSANRPKETSLRVGTGYARATVAYQRKQLVKLLGDRLDANKLSRGAYIKELENSKVVVSPFGLGEITLRDFEIFMAGALMLKPDMSHMETWPNFYVANETMVTHRWDLSDFDEKLGHILSNYADYLEIAAEGQARYAQHTIGKDAGRLFAEHLFQLLRRCDHVCSA